jgi:hypothetical protein
MARALRCCTREVLDGLELAAAAAKAASGADRLKP